MKAVFILMVMAVAGAAFLAFVYSGVYNVAATEPHTRIVAWILHTVMEHSVKARAGEVTLPADLGEGKSEGFGEFYKMCEQCHGGPGVKPSAIGKGLNPEPPDLKEKALEWSDAELFWIVKNGIKMSGMPGFGPTHKDEEIRDIVAFVKKLPEKSSEEYRMLMEQQDKRADRH